MAAIEPTREELLREVDSLRARLRSLDRRGGERDERADVPGDERPRDACVSAVLREGREALLRAWEERVLQDPTVEEAERLDPPALRDHVPALLDELTAALDRASTSHGSVGEAIGRAVWHSPSAFAHAEQRLAQGYTLPEVMRELSHLRTAIADRCRAHCSGGEHDELRVVHVAIDEAMTVAATELERMARAQLLASEERFRTIVESVRDYAVLMLDADGSIATWNPGAEGAKGWTAEEIVGRPYATLFTLEDRTAGEPARILAVAREEGAWRGRAWRVRKDGSTYIAELTLTAIHGTGGEVVAYSVVSRDVTAIVEAEQRVAASEARLEAILSTAMDAIVTTDSAGRVVLFNRSAEEAFGRRADEVLGAPVELLMPERFRAAHPGHMRRFRQTGETSRAPGSLGRLVGLRASGDEFPIEASISQTEVGGEHYFTIVLRDVSERVREERARREAESRLGAVLDNALAIIFVKDRDGRYELVNRRFEEALGVARDDALGRTDAEIFPPEAAAIYRANDLEVLARGAPIVAEERAPQADGVHTYVSVKFPLQGESGEIRAIAGIATDITERVRAKDALAREIELRELFVGVLAHDLRTPLSAIVMSAEMLARDDLEPSARRTVERIARGARRIASMIDQLLDLTRARSGAGLPIERGPTDLAEVCRAIADELSASRPERAIHLEVRGDPRGAWDATRLGQVVSNLLSNALAYSPPDMAVGVRLDGNGDTVSLEIHNANADGPIPPEAFPSLFDPFARGGRGSRGEGLGLGLFIVDQIAKAHGGDVRVRSDEGGTTFTVRLPRGT